MRYKKTIGKIIGFIILFNFLVITTVSCLPEQTQVVATIPSVSREATRVSGTITPSSATEAITTPPNTPMQTPESTTISNVALTPTAVSPTPQMPQFSSTPTSITGNLLSYNQEGIYLLSLETGQLTYLLTWPSDVLVYYVSFSPNGERVVYWQQTTTSSEIWVTELEPWSPELLLTLPDSNYDGVGADWVGTERYLRFSLARPNELGISTVAATYLVDTEELEIEASIFNWETLCPYLAISPRTNRLSTWCIQGDGSFYLVVETNGELWTALEAPDNVLVNKEQYSLSWAWSRNGEYVAFTNYITETILKQLFVSKVGDGIPIPLTESESGKYLALSSLSSTGEYLSYTGVCSDGVGCKLVMHIPTQEIVWTSRMIPNLATGASIAWSPDSRYFVTSDFNNFYVVDLLNQQIVKQFARVPHESMVWLNE